jgi:hypothetical protein
MSVIIVGHAGIPLHLPDVDGRRITPAINISITPGNPASRPETRERRLDSRLRNRLLAEPSVQDSPSAMRLTP